MEVGKYAFNKMVRRWNFEIPYHITNMKNQHGRWLALAGMVPKFNKCHPQLNKAQTQKSWQNQLLAFALVFILVYIYLLFDIYSRKMCHQVKSLMHNQIRLYFVFPLLGFCCINLNVIVSGAWTNCLILSWVDFNQLEKIRFISINRVISD